MKDEIKEILDINIGNDREAYIDYIDKDGKRKNYEYIEAEDLLDHITNLQEEVKSANESITWWNNRFNAVQEENEELKMTNLALADDITKNKIIKQEVLTECCGIPIGEIPMLKIQNDEYKQRIDEATKELEKLLPLCIMPNNTLIHGTEKAKVIEKAINLLQGKSDE